MILSLNELLHYRDIDYYTIVMKYDCDFHVLKF